MGKFTKNNFLNTFNKIKEFFRHKDISESRVTDGWIFLEALNQHGKRKAVYVLFDFMRDLECDLMDDYKNIKK